MRSWFSTQTLITFGYGLLALEVAFVLLLYFTRNMGDDAAGRGMARGLAIVLAPIVLVAGGVFIWGARGGPRGALWVGLFLVYIPVIYLAVSTARGTFGRIDRALGRAQIGRFPTSALTALGRAIVRADTARVAELLGRETPDWDTRDAMGRTLLGHAIDAAIAYEGRPAHLDIVRKLLDAGAPVRDSELSAGRTMASVSEHNLVYHLYGVHNPAALEVLDLVLSRGLSPDQVDEDGVPIYFSTYTVLPALEVLAKHGADFTRLDPRTDRLHQTALMAWLNLREWAICTFFLAHGVSPDHTAPDGRSARSILAEVDPPGSTYTDADTSARATFLAAWERATGATR